MNFISEISKFFENKTIGYVSINKFVIAFIQDMISDGSKPRFQSFAVYCIFKKKKNVDKYVDNIIFKLLTQIALEFKIMHKAIKTSDLILSVKLKKKIAEILKNANPLKIPFYK